MQGEKPLKLLAVVIADLRCEPQIPIEAIGVRIYRTAKRAISEVDRAPPVGAVIAPSVKHGVEIDDCVTCG